MKKLLVLLLLPLFSFGQIIVNKETTKETRQYIAEDGSTKTQVKKITRTFNITEIQDEFIEIRLGKNYHLLSTSKHKNIKISSQSKYWNVYDGGVLIPMQDEVDILNFFSKYGFEYFKQSTTTSTRNSSAYVPPTNYTATSRTTNFGSFSRTTTDISPTPSFSGIFNALFDNAASSKSSKSIIFKNNNN